MPDIECFTYLNRALESTLAPIVIVYFICIYIYITVFVVSQVHMLDIECFTYLNRLVLIVILIYI